jgi:membrane protease subunit HflC
MPRNRLTILAASLVLVVLLLELVAFRVRETEVVVVKTFGKATRPVREPGLYWKWPWPIEEVVRQDARLRVLEGTIEETLTEDRKSVLVSCFVTWRVGDPVRFLESTETAEAGERQLERLLRNYQRTALGGFPFSALVATDRAQLGWDKIEEAIRVPLETVARDELGIEVVFVGIKGLELPKDTTERVFDRMKREREVKAAQLLSQGQSEAGEIRAAAERERQEALDAAEAEKRRLLAQADQESEAAYKVFEQDPELAIYLKKIEALKRALAGRTTLVLDTSSPPFDLLAPAAAVDSSGRGGPR